MTKPQLHLAPHELEQNRRADVDGEPFVFRVQWFGSEREFIGQVVGQKHTPMIFFGLADEPERGNFVNARRFVSKKPGVEAPPVFEPRTQVPYANEDALRCLELTATEGWGRLFFLNEDLQPTEDQPVWRLFLAQSGWGEWSAAPDFYMKSARFRWNENGDEARNLAHLPSLELLQHSLPELRDPNSDAAFARRFAPLKGTARHQLCRPLQHGSYAEWEHVLRLFIQSRTELWLNKSSVHYDIYVYAKQTQVSSKTCFNLQFPKFYKWTRRYFAPALDKDLLGSCVAAQAWHTRRFSWSERIEQPTQHERLEALLQLREWLADKAAPDEIELLLREE